MNWISVKDRLPINDDYVLVYNYRDGIHIGYFSGKNWDVQYEWAPHERTTHWMPLPDEPKDNE